MGIIMYVKKVGTILQQNGNLAKDLQDIGEERMAIGVPVHLTWSAEIM